MESEWIEMHLEIPATGVDLVSQELVELGSEGITVEERALDTFVAPDPEEMLSPDYRIKAYFRAVGDVEELLGKVMERLAWLSPFVPGLVLRQPEVRTVHQEDWAEGWKQHFSAVRIGPRLVVKPTWEAFDSRDEDVIVNLDPGMAFGTGTHGTTRLCLEALAGLFEESAPSRVLDVGTGSGILAIAAAALGADHVLACDLDEQACSTALENARLNGVERQIEITASPLDTLEGGFQIVLANILAEENIRLASQLVERLAPGGALILSGILKEKESLVIEAFSDFPLSGPAVSHREEWSCLLYRKEP